MIGRQCKATACRFVAVGILRVQHASKDVAHIFGLCAIHRDDITQEAIDSSRVGAVDWIPRTDWATDGAAA